MRWYAVMTKARKEELAQKNLRWQGYQTFYPHYLQWTNPKKTKPRCLRKPYLTRYLFVGMTRPTHSMYQINNTIGVSTVVYCGVQALSIPMAIVEELQGRADPHGEVQVDKPDSTFPGRAGDWVKFKDHSPLFGFLAEIKRVDTGGRLMVELNKMLGSTRDVEVSDQDVGEIVLRAKESPRPLEPIQR